MNADLIQKEAAKLAFNDIKELKTKYANLKNLVDNLHKIKHSSVDISRKYDKEYNKILVLKSKGKDTTELEETLKNKIYNELYDSALIYYMNKIKIEKFVDGYIKPSPKDLAKSAMETIIDYKRKPFVMVMKKLKEGSIPEINYKDSVRIYNLYKELDKEYSEIIKTGNDKKANKFSAYMEEKIYKELYEYFVNYYTRIQNNFKKNKSNFTKIGSDKWDTLDPDSFYS